MAHAVLDLEFIQRNLGKNGLLKLYLRCDLRRDQEVDEEFFHLLALERHSVLEVTCYYLVQRWQEVDAEVDLRGSVQAPVEQLD